MRAPKTRFYLLMAKSTSRVPAPRVDTAFRSFATRTPSLTSRTLLFPPFPRMTTTTRKTDALRARADEQTVRDARACPSTPVCYSLPIRPKCEINSQHPP